MLVYLIRHGETKWNLKRLFQGQSDIELTDRGLEEAKEARNKLSDIRFDKVFSSPLGRAYKTASIITEGKDIDIETDQRLIEMGFGRTEGVSIDDIKSDPQNPLYYFIVNPGKYHKDPSDLEMEDIEDVEARAREFVNEKIIPLEGECENVLVVAHGALLRTIINPVRGYEKADFWCTRVANCQVYAIEVLNGELKLIENRYTEPLEKEKVAVDPLNGK